MSLADLGWSGTPLWVMKPLISKYTKHEPLPLILYQNIHLRLSALLHIFVSKTMSTFI